MQKLAGKLQHASFAMPGGWGLFSPIQRALQGDPKFIHMTEDLKECLSDWKTILRHLATNPTHVLQLVDGFPDYLGYTDACGKGAGGVWMGITEDIGHTCGEWNSLRRYKTNYAPARIQKDPLQ